MSAPAADNIIHVDQQAVNLNSTAELGSMVVLWEFGKNAQEKTCDGVNRVGLSGGLPNMTKKIAGAVAAALFILPSVSRAYFDAGLEHVSGSNGYSGLNGYGIVGFEKGLWLKPAAGMYSSDSSNGTFRTYSGRVGYDTDLYTVAGEAGATPVVDGYRNSYVGGDITFSISSSGGKKTRLAGPQMGGSPRGKGLAQIDLGVGLRQTAHSDELDSSGAKRADSMNIGQTDVAVFAGARFLSTNLSANYTRSGYNKTLSAADKIRASKRQVLPGLSSVIQGFPKQSWSFRADWTLLPFVSPFASYTYTQFELGQPASASYRAGASVGLDMLEVRGAVEVYDPGGGAAKSNFYSLGAGIRF